MEKVWVVWYRNDHGRANIWGIYSTEEKAIATRDYIETDYNWTAWYNDEEVQ